MFNVYVPRRTYVLMPIVGMVVFLAGLADSACWLVLKDGVMPSYSSLFAMVVGLWLQTGYKIRLRRT